MYAVHGELTADGSSIVLVAAGVSDHWVAQAAKQAELLTPLVKATKPAGGLMMPLSWPAVVQLGHTYGKAWRPGPRLVAWTVAQIQARTAAPRIAYTPPAGLTPYPWQLEGAAMIAAVGSVLITDEPRTGKTITTILGLLGRTEYADFGPALVVCPASVVDPWVAAWRAWAPGLRAVAWRGSPAARRALAGTADVYVVSYDTARADAAGGTYTNLADKAPLRALRPASLVVDECHLIKSPHAARSHAVRRLAKGAGTVVALSGTPITHNPADLWPTLVALEPAAWPSRERWVARYCQSLASDYGESILGLSEHREPEFRASLFGATRRVARADVLGHLPPKVYSVRTVELPADWRKTYDGMESQMLAGLYNEDGEYVEMTAMERVSQLTRLSQLACAAADVEITTELDEVTGETKQHQHVTLRLPSWKVDALLEVLAERPGDPTIAFAPSRQLVMLAGLAAEKAGHRVGYVVGGQTQRERTRNREAFQAGALDLLCATTGAGGVGLTLTAAGTVVFLQRPYSLVESSQSEDRAEGIGSETPNGTEIIDVVASNTIDTRVRSVLRGKAGQLAHLLQDPRIVAELLGGAGVRPIKQRKAS
jgi:SNF2 family DNA or RNA helicase